MKRIYSHLVTSQSARRAPSVPHVPSLSNPPGGFRFMFILMEINPLLQETRCRQCGKQFAKVRRFLNGIPAF